ncbi:MAG: hypothetical protein QOJ27_1323 [Sphingomonadales bacterium]|jgi:hypothetical protein|nr:hypothetical protein [Sphingomonadales bacterium]
MRYTFSVRKGRKTLGRQDRELHGDHEARLQALSFAAHVMREAGSPAAKAGNLIVDVCDPRGEVHGSLHIRFVGQLHPALAEDDYDGEGHPS